MEIRKINKKDFLQLDFKVKSPEYLRLDCLERLNLPLLASLTLASDCGVEIDFANILLRSNSYHSRDDELEYNQFF